MTLYLLQWRAPGRAEWRTLRAEIHARNSQEAIATLRGVRKRAEVPPGSVFRVVGPMGWSHYFLRPEGSEFRGFNGKIRGNFYERQEHATSE